MNNKNRLLAIVAVSAFSLWASPAMAQDGFGGANDGFGGPPSESKYFVQNEMDYGTGCSRKKPKECSPEQRDQHNRLVAILCNIAGGAGGVVGGVFVGVATAPVLSPVGSGVAGGVYGTALGLLLSEACIERNSIP